MNRALLIIARRPAPGKTKTRLIGLLTPAQVSLLYEGFLQDTLQMARAVPDATRILLYTPDEEAAYFKSLAPDFSLLSQVGLSLGERLDNALSWCLNAGFQRVVIVDSDSPTLPSEHLNRAFLLLEGTDVVLGPSDDGGYYLIGLSRPQPRLLRAVEMSTPTVLHDTLAIAAQEGLRVALAPRWYDVDTVADLQRLLTELSITPGHLAPQTRQVLATFSRVTSEDKRFLLRSGNNL